MVGLLPAGVRILLIMCRDEKQVMGLPGNVHLEIMAPLVETVKTRI